MSGSLQEDVCEIEGLERKVKKLQAENEKLKKMLGILQAALNKLVNIPPVSDESLSNLEIINKEIDALKGDKKDE
jgi:hypothetical protein